MKGWRDCTPAMYHFPPDEFLFFKRSVWQSLPHCPQWCFPWQLSNSLWVLLSTALYISTFVGLSTTSSFPTSNIKRSWKKKRKHLCCLTPFNLMLYLKKYLSALICLSAWIVYSGGWKQKLWAKLIMVPIPLSESLYDDIFSVSTFVMKQHECGDTPLPPPRRS